jgi:hypothetical protein
MMKTYVRVLTITAASTLALCTTGVHAQALAEVDATAARAGIVKVVTGDVRVRDALGERALVLGNNSQFEVQQFAFDATTQKGNIFVNLLQGSMRMLTGLIAKVNPESIQVKTKTLSVGIRGTDFIVETEDKL